jgi:hypothetical protein
VDEIHRAQKNKTPESEYQMKVTLSAKMAAFARLRPNEESLLWTLYHFMQPPAGVIPDMTYFKNAPGQTDQFGAQVTDEDTNLEVGGQLSSPNRMFVSSVCVSIEPASTQSTPFSGAASQTIADDIWQVAKRGFFQFTMLVKPYLKLSPLGLLPAGYGISAAIAAATPAAGAALTPSLAQNGNPSEKGYKVAFPLESQTTFKASISFPKSAVTLINALRIGVLLHGVLYRPEQ